MSSISMPPPVRRSTFPGTAGSRSSWDWTIFERLWRFSESTSPVTSASPTAFRQTGSSSMRNWCRFLAAEGFAVGLSLDGPQEMHDRYRVTRGQNPTHTQVMRGYGLLRAAPDPRRYPLRGACRERPASHRGLPVLQADRRSIPGLSAPG